MYDRVDLANRIAENIENHKNEGLLKEYHVFFVPRRTMICVTLLEEHGVDNGNFFCIFLCLEFFSN